MHQPPLSPNFIIRERSAVFEEAPVVSNTPIARNKMTNSSGTHLRRLAPPGYLSQRHLRMVFESPVLKGMTPCERDSAIAQLAILLLQAAGVHHTEADDGEH